MNERINELFSEALDGAVPETWTTLDANQLNRLKEKFAELIVRECANAAYQSLYEDRIFDDNPHIIRTRVMDDIKKHFGVEE